jgi:hypothetical protein
MAMLHTNFNMNAKGSNIIETTPTPKPPLKQTKKTTTHHPQTNKHKSKQKIKQRANPKLCIEFQKRQALTVNCLLSAAYTYM